MVNYMNGQESIWLLISLMNGQEMEHMISHMMGHMMGHMKGLSLYNGRINGLYDGYMMSHLIEYMLECFFCIYKKIFNCFQWF